MADHYIEFDSTPQTLLADLRAQILTSSDWSRLGADTVLLNTSAGTAVGATTLPFASTAGTSLAIGSVIAIDDGANREYRTITNMTGATITVAALTFAHNAGAAIRSGSELYKATTTRGAQMVVDLSDTHPDTTRLALAVYRSHDGTTGVDKITRFLWWKYTTGTYTMPLHVLLSLGKEHFFLQIEGPRGGEVSPANANYGSQKQYFFLCDFIPYYPVEDTIPTVVCGGSSLNDPGSSVANLNHQAAISRNYQNTASWQPIRLQSLEFPQAGFGLSLNVQRANMIDGKWTLTPYVGFMDEIGLRGRLAKIFFCGHSLNDNPEAPVPPIGSKQKFNGSWYKLISANKSDGRNSIHVWGPLGAANNAAASVYLRSPVIAVPCLP